MTNEEKRSLRVFLCHASGDKPAVRDLYTRLVADGVDTWLDQEKLLPGQEWQVEIPRAVRESDVNIVCLSDKSITKEGYVQKEIKFALDIASEKPEGTIFLIPARLEECEVPLQLRRWQWVDLFLENGYEHLMRALRRRAEEIGITIKTSLPSAEGDKELQRFKELFEWQSDIIKIDEHFTSTQESEASVLIKYIVEWLAQKGWTEKRAGVAEFAMQEILDNAFKHGLNPEDKNAKIRIRAELSSDRLTCKITDSGRGFDLEKKLRIQNVQRQGGLWLVDQLASSLKQVDPNTIGVTIARNPVSIYLETIEGIRILSMYGKFDYRARAEYEKINQISESLPDRVKLVLDLTETTYLCSKALYYLTELVKYVRNHHGKLITVVKADSRVIDVIKLAGFEDIFKLVDTRSEALAALRTSKKRKSST